MLIVAIVVTYKPDIAVLTRMLSALRDQVQVIVISHNNETDDLSPLIPTTLYDSVIVMGGNLGVATAQNAGIAFAKRVHATHVLLMDQDSLPSRNMVAKMAEAVVNIDTLACVGPRYLDPRQDNPPPFIKMQGVRLLRCKCDGLTNLIDVDYVISSGCLIPMQAIERVGIMKDELFIDYVDIEWGLRAKSMGLRSYGVCDALMQHSLGDSPYMFRGRAIPVHNPLRHYYLFRNAIILYKAQYIPINWKIVDACKLVLKFGFYSLLVKPRWQHFKMMAKGLFNGFWGISGKLKS